MRSDEFPERKFSEQCWTHNLVQLLGVAGLTAELSADAANDPDLRANWAATSVWSESSRYAAVTKVVAEQLYNAITEKKHGVFSWIKQRW